MTSIINNRFVLTADQRDMHQAIIKVIGVGGGGSNAIDYMMDQNIEGVEFYVANTDAQALMAAGTAHKIQIGKALTRGLGAGANPAIGRDAALEDPQEIINRLGDADMIFVTAGMGGGTGTGAAPIITRIIKEAAPQTLVVAIVTKPFEFEGIKRMDVACVGLHELKKEVDSLITIPNERILEGQDVSIRDAFGKVNDVLLGAVKGIADLVTRPGYINVDFADVKTVLSENGATMMGTGSAKREEGGAAEAARKAIHNTIISDINVSDASGLLINISGSSSMTTRELREIGDVVQEFVSRDANIITGHVFDEELEDEIIVTIVATGISEQEKYEDVGQQHESVADETAQMSEDNMDHANSEFDHESEDDSAENGFEPEGTIDLENHPVLQEEYSEEELPAVFRNFNGNSRPSGNGEFRY